MKPANDTTLRVIADGLIHRAECRPRGCEGGRLLREAAANLLDADMAIQAADEAMIRPANDLPRQTGDKAA
jgi:hypothetical protein